MKDSESLPRYFKEIKSITILSQEEETLLLEKIRKGDTYAKEKLIKANLRFVITLAQKFKFESNGLLLEDLINEGNLGLIHSIEKFKEEKEARFLSYAGYWIRKFIQEAIDRKGKTIHLPRKKAELLRKIKKAKELLEGRWGRNICCDELADHLNISEKAVAELWDYLSTQTSFEASIKLLDDKYLLLCDVLADEESKSVEELLEQEERKKRITYLLSTLTEKQRLVIELYFGFDNDTTFTLEEISQMLNISKERARQLREAGLKNLRKKLIGEGV